MKSLLIAGVAMLALAGCGSSTADTSAARPSPAQGSLESGLSAPLLPGTAKIDPATVKISKCSIKKDDYGDGQVSYATLFEGEVRNSTKTTGMVSVTVQYQDSTGKAIENGAPSATHIAPGQSAKLTDTLPIEIKDFPDSKIRCLPTEAAVYEQ